jgi:hypothetical protein
MARDIDYAAIAVKNAIAEKFGRTNELQDLDVAAGERTIVMRHADLAAEGSRDDILAAVRGAATYDAFWEALPRPRA